MNRVLFTDLNKQEYAEREAINSLRTNLSFCGADLKAFLVTSCFPNEGKSTVAFELARSMAQSGKKTVLVDADLRKSVMISRYKMKRQGLIKGLSHFLVKQATEEEIVCESNIDNMDVIITGPLPPNPTSILDGELFEQLMQYLRERYDVIIVDGTPMALVIDSAIIAKQCDGTLIVVESEKTSKRALIDVKEQLEMAGCNILGVVMNKVQPRKGKYGSYGKYGKYGKYGAYGAYGEYGTDTGKTKKKRAKKAKAVKKGSQKNTDIKG